MFQYFTSLIKQIYEEMKNCCFIKSQYLPYKEKQKKLYNNNKFKISAPTWNDKFQLPDKSNSVSKIQDYFEYGENTDNPSIKIYVNIIENRITFKIKTGYYLELLMPTTMKLLGSTENKKTNDKNGENVPQLKMTEVVLVHCNIVNNDYQQDSRVLYRFVSNRPLVVSQDMHQQILSF